MRFFALGLIAALGQGGFTQTGSAAELISIPNGATIRTLFDWEGTSALEVFLNNISNRVTSVTPHQAEFQFSNTQLCQQDEYRVGIAAADGSVAGAKIDLGRLCTGVEQADFTFAFLSDTQQYHAEHEKVAKVLAGFLASDSSIRFVLNGGDLVQESSDTEWKQYRAIATKYYSNIVPLVPVVGNHDYRNDLRLEGFNRVYATTSTLAHY